MTAFLLAALAAASAVYWGLKWPGSKVDGPIAALAMLEAAPADPLALARALGGGNATVAAAPAMGAPVVNTSSRLALVGVVANGKSRGAALISIDGKPARPYRVGSSVDDGLVLQSVEPRRALLAAQLDGPASLTLELPQLKP